MSKWVVVVRKEATLTYEVEAESASEAMNAYKGTEPVTVTPLLAAEVDVRKMR